MKNNTILQNILNQYAYDRELAENSANLKFQSALQNEKYNNLQKDISALKFLIVENEIKNVSTTNEKLKLSTLLSKEKALLKNLGYNSDSFKPQYSCLLCNDTGFLNNTYCSCLKKQYYKELFQIWGLNNVPEFTFDDSDLSIIKNEKHNTCLITLYSKFIKYCNKFPNVIKKNALIMGGTGTGKTYLMCAIYNGLIKRRFNPIFINAIQLNSIMLKYHLEPIATRDIFMADLLDCDLLIIDDLGTEQIFKNVTKEYLLHILDTRSELKKPILATTNLNGHQLKNFYNERIFSRLSNRKTTNVGEIIGCDIRLLK